MENRGKESFRAQVVAFVLGFGACAGIVRFMLPLPVGASSPPGMASVNPAEVAQAVSQSVVTIETFQEPKTQAEFDWRDLFKISAPEPEPASVASGVIISRDGYLVTNAHVVEDARRVRVRLADEHEFEARMVGKDVHADLAVLKISAHNLEAARMGDSHRLRPGEPVVAIGNPLGFEHSVSVGVVSANRVGPIRVDGSVLGDMIQTDAAINQGNSGGGLFTSDGRLIGINTAIMVPRGGSGSIGIGFAIPTHRVEPVIHTLISLGRVPRPWLGIRYQPTRGETLVRQVRHGFGVLVEDVLPDSPAATAGLRPADILRQIGDCRIRSADDIYSVVERYRPGTRIQARVLRGDHERAVSLVLGELPSRP
jgi:S1-C subfamily serine protease